MEGIKRVLNRCIENLNLEGATLSEEYYYGSLPLCIIDAVYSIGVNYKSTRNTVIRYCEYFGFERLRANKEAVPGREKQQSISEFIEVLKEKGSEFNAENIFKNRQRTSSQNGILKAEAVLRFAEVLKEMGVEHLQDMGDIINDDDFLKKIKEIPGQKSGISTQYFFMLAGSNDFIKPDRMVLRFLKEALGRDVTLVEAEKILKEVSDSLKGRFENMNPRLLDHEIWKYQSGSEEEVKPKMNKGFIIEKICESLSSENKEEGRRIINEEYPFEHVEYENRKYSKKKMIDIFIRDGFTDRYSGKQLIFPPVLKILSEEFPEEFPYHKNWKMSESHIAYWELYPTIDHITAIARGGDNDIDNLVTTSMIRNSAKSSFTLEEIQWELKPSRDFKEWDGKFKWFMDHMENNKDKYTDRMILDWYRASVKYCEENPHILSEKVVMPKGKDMIIPLINFLKKKEIVPFKELVDGVGKDMNLNERIINSITVKGTRRFATKLSYTGTDLKKAGIIESPKSGLWRLSEKGRELSEVEVREMFEIV